MRDLISILLLIFLTSSCDLNAPDGDDNDPDPEEQTRFEVIRSSGLSGNTTKAKAVDIDQNGDPDLILAIADQSNKILMNDGTGGFEEGSDRLPDQRYIFNTQDLAVADFNGDTYTDILFVGDQASAFELYINNSSGYFSDLSNRIPITDQATSVAAWDIDGSGTTDLMIGTVGQNVVLVNNGSVVFTNQTEARLPTQVEYTTEIKMGDITGDNLIDVVSGSDQFNRLLVNAGSGTFIDQTEQLLPADQAAEETRDIELLDINKDGLTDMYWGITGENAETAIQDRLFINQGQGRFFDQTSERLPDLETATIDAEFVDLDIDGDLDLLIGSASNGLFVFLNNGNGAFIDHSSNWIPTNFTPPVNDLEVADFNGDHLPDLFIAVQDGDDRMLIQR